MVCCFGEAGSGSAVTDKNRPKEQTDIHLLPAE